MIFGLETGEGGEPGGIADEPEPALGWGVGAREIPACGGATLVPHRPQKPAPSWSGVPQLPQNLAMVALKEHLPTCKQVVNGSPRRRPTRSRLTRLMHHITDSPVERCGIVSSGRWRFNSNADADGGGNVFSDAGDVRGSGAGFHQQSDAHRSGHGVQRVTGASEKEEG